MNHNVIIVIALIIVVISMLAMLIRVVLGHHLRSCCRIRCDWSSINGSYSIIQYFIKY